MACGGEYQGSCVLVDQVLDLLETSGFLSVPETYLCYILVEISA